MARGDRSQSDGSALTLTVREQRLDRPMPQLDRYELRGLLGAGGMGKVYKALDTRLGREVAIKVVSEADPRDEARLLSEARALAQVRHPNVVPSYDVGVAARDVYIVMPMVTGGTLRTWLVDDRPWRSIVTTFIAAGRGLVAAHDVGAADSRTLHMVARGHGTRDGKRITERSELRYAYDVALDN